MLINGLDWNKKEIERQIKYYKKEIEYAKKELEMFEGYLKEIEKSEICGFCTKYDSDNSYCPHRGTMYEEDSCDYGFQSEEEKE